MCALIPLLLAAAVVPWALGAPVAVSVGINLLAVGCLVVFWRMATRPVEAVGGVPVAALKGHPCPACGATDTAPWLQGRLPVGLHCQRCGTRSGAADLARGQAGQGENTSA